MFSDYVSVILCKRYDIEDMENFWVGFDLRLGGFFVTSL